MSDATPTLAGTPGTARDDAGTVTVRLYAGGLAAGAPARTLSAARDGATGAWSTSAGRLADGTWTVRAEQSDAAGNSGASAPVTFRVDTTPPGFALAPAEEKLAGALARGVPIFAGCASACRVSATLSMSAAKARALGLPAGRRSLPALAATLARGAARTFALRPSLAARRALRRLGSLKARLSVDVTGAGTRVRLRQAVRLTRTAGLRRIARRGLPLRAACSESCTVSARLGLPAANARRLGLRAPRGAPLTVARETVRASPAPSRLVLAVDRRYRRALRRARRGSKAVLEARVQGSTGPPQRLNRRVILQR